jgi:hypothetical protein
VLELEVVLLEVVKYHFPEFLPKWLLDMLPSFFLFLFMISLRTI